MNKPMKYNIFHPDCPARVFFEKFADKWILLIIYKLSQEAQHFNQLRKSILGISPKILSQKLKILERDGFITRTVQEDSVIRVEYALTALGYDFADTAYQLKDWIELNLEKVMTSRTKFDAIS
ncbi:transcriptional regulator [Acinetobacter sp. ANC 4558]|uniref:winged helix-turn-helix transcriptional regulator n=1 Tax=Acinetobacter sp. ANC 4558 TaxID=1977876 RepID=UPI000A3372FD|nr:helix-turn-helix domain-containing protein [Acinetobacter sp. ANC 4558]OTG87651.1 transcriptional regulator [Acinetobacter sp. ANC 4558]